MDDSLTIGMAQIAPVWLDKRATLDKVCARMTEAAEKDCQLIIFGEALVPGYPFWVEQTDGARFDSDLQKEMYAWYMSQAVDPTAGDLQQVCDLAKQHNMACILGTIERAADRGSHSLYCTLVYIDANGTISTTHRKLVPTYEERLVWSNGDGHGLRTHELGPFKVGALNCWENWMPLARTALYALGEDLHVAIWPGSDYNTRDITRFIARESRSYVISVSSLFNPNQITTQLPDSDLLRSAIPQFRANGGSCIAQPNGEWLVEPILDEEGLFTATLDHAMVRRERQNFDPAGHYSRPDVTKLEVNRERQSVVQFKD